MEENIYNLTTTQQQEIADVLDTRIERGLREDNTEIKCFPTYIKPNLNIQDGKVLVLDLGGTNFRAAVVDFKKGKVEIHPENGFATNLATEMKTPNYQRDQLFAKIADLISGLNLEGVHSIGYCFSYPSECMTDGDAVLIEWTKGVVVEGMVGELVGKELMDYLNKNLKNVNFTSIKVINDTVASLFAGLTKTGYDSYIGLIVGTGTNMAGFIHSDNIPKLNAEYKKKHPGLLPVNLESGNFHPPHLTRIDAIVDASSGTKGKQRFEKAVSGMYLGKILKYTFPYDELEEDFDAAKLTNIINYPDIHKEKYVEVSRQIYSRSAQMVAASLAGLIEVMVKHDKSIKKVLLTAEGSLFWSKIKGIDYKIIVDVELGKLLEEMGMDVQVDIIPIKNANLIGSAIAAMS